MGVSPPVHFGSGSDRFPYASHDTDDEHVTRVPTERVPDSHGMRQMDEMQIEPRSCLRCARAMVSITLDIHNAKRTLHSCSHCDVRIWEAPGEVVNLQGILNELADSGD